MSAANAVLISRTRADLKSGAARSARIAARMSQADVAAALGVARSAVGHWESGRSVPSAEHALDYGKLLRSLAKAAA